LIQRAIQMATCAKCKKLLGFFERQSIRDADIGIAFPEYKGKDLCNVCAKELEKAAPEEMKRRYIEKLNQEDPDISTLISAPTKLKLFEVGGYILYHSKNRTNINENVTRIMQKIPVHSKIKPFYVQAIFLDIIKQGYVSKIDRVTNEYKLTNEGERWVEDTVLPKLKGVEVLDEDINKAILWQKDEIPLGQFECKEFFEDRTSSMGARIGHKGTLIVTNQRILFAYKLGRLASENAVMYGTNLENIVTVSHGRFGFNDKLVILEGNNQHRDFVQPNIQWLISTINNAITDRKNQLLAEKQKERIQIVLDFSSLKEVMSKGGLVMTTFKCPNCNGMVDLPEAGKVLMCKYCGTPIKPVDIFEKIKSLIS
jgi:hypothetical protein